MSEFVKRAKINGFELIFARFYPVFEQKFVKI